MTPEPRSAEAQACAHLHVEYFTRHRDDGTTEGWWACRECRSNFLPYAVHYVLTAQETAALQRDYDERCERGAQTILANSREIVALQRRVEALEKAVKEAIGQVDAASWSENVKFDYITKPLETALRGGETE